MSPEPGVLTGFGSFPGVVHNPTAALVAPRLQGPSPPRGAVLTVGFHAAREGLAALLAGPEPAWMLHLGVATGSTRLRLERQAVNTRRATIPDVSGLRSDGEVVDPALPAAAVLTCAVDLDAIVMELRDQGLAARTSDDAGRYVCNALYLHALATRRARGWTCPCLFLHVPPVGAHPPGDGPPWTLDRLSTAVDVVIRHLASPGAAAPPTA